MFTHRKFLDHFQATYEIEIWQDYFNQQEELLREKKLGLPEEQKRLYKLGSPISGYIFPHSHFINPQPTAGKAEAQFNPTEQANWKPGNK